MEGAGHGGAVSSLPPSHILVPPAPEPAPCSSFHYLFGVWATAPHWSPCPVLSCPPIRPLRGLCRISLKPSQVLLLPSFGWGGSWDPRTPASSLIAPQLIPLCKPPSNCPQAPKIFSCPHPCPLVPTPRPHCYFCLCAQFLCSLHLSDHWDSVLCLSSPTPSLPEPGHSTQQIG